MKTIKSMVIKKDIFFYLKKKTNSRSALYLKEKKELLYMISKSTGRKITSVNTIFLSQKLMFGNQIILINLVIFFCEILGCKKIIIDKNWNWFIKHKIIYRKYRMIINVGEINDYKPNNYTIFDFSTNFFYYSKYFKPELRMNIIKKEIIKNVPEFKIKSNSLYLYIRSGDIFIKSYNKMYSQPPLCFYQTIINNKTFDDIYIIAKDKRNPVINYLLNQYSNIVYKQNDLKTDIGHLIKAYNIVGGVSTFINVIIRLNDNLLNYWEYNIDSLKAKINHFHHLFYTFQKKFNIFVMEPTDKYLTEMKFWHNNKYQKQLMIKEKCLNKFVQFS
jgi:hypothetical protein